MQSLIKATRRQILHAVTKCPDTGEHHGISTRDDCRVAADLHLGTNLREAILHAPEIPSAVIHNGQHAIS
jgi:hypothetical protein